MSASIPTRRNTSSFLASWPMYHRAKENVRIIAESIIITIIMTFFTIWSLFDDDIRLSGTEENADLSFEVIISIAFFFFSFEFLANCFYKEDYFIVPNFNDLNDKKISVRILKLLQWGSFYFWLDLIATFSLVTEMPWMVPRDAFGNANNFKAARAGRASRAGARAGRIVRVIRMIKLYKYFNLQKEKEKEKEKKLKTVTENVVPIPSTERPNRRSSIFQSIPTVDGAELDVEQEKKVIKQQDTSSGEFGSILPESRVGAAMSEITTKRVIVLVLSMLLIIPLTTYHSTSTEHQFAVKTLHEFAKKNYTYGNYTADMNIQIDYLISDLSALKITLNNSVIYKSDIFSKRRIHSEIRPITAESHFPSDKEFITKVWFDYKDVSRTAALFNIYTTLFVLVLLLIGTYIFSNDVNRLVINPIERMVQLVQKISEDPLGQDYSKVNLGSGEGFIEGMETTVLLTTITKIGSLMRVGFGDAGASVIASVLNEGGNDINLVGAENGRLIHSIFGFCDVRNFTDTTECLQEEVMLFVNRIAHILHSIVAQCSGCANKNIGDAFLLTWKIETTMNSASISELADKALLAFCKTLIELCRYQDFIMNFSVPATTRLHRRHLTKVRIGAGLHVGWAVEGAIGSQDKIDASYLSPHVHMTEFLESSTKQYGVSLLLSEPFYRILSLAATKWIRQVDRVRRSDGEEPFGIFTYDADLECDWPIPVESAPVKSYARVSTRDNSGNRRDQRRPTNKSNSLVSEEEMTMGTAPEIKLVPYLLTVWESDEDLITLRHNIKDSFRAIWKEGIASYIKGDWQKARDIFHETLQMSDGHDGPSKFLVGVIDSHGGSAPQDWHGYRNV